MSDDLRLLLTEQTTTINLIKRVIINYKKLPKANITLSKTKGRLEDLKTHWEKAQRLHCRISHLATADDCNTLSYFLHEEFFAAEDAYNAAADILHDAISNFVKTDVPACDGSTDSSFRDANSQSSLQLPRIALPKFSGQFTDWENFRSTFESLIATNDALSNTQKFHYLKSSVQGDAALLINNLKITDANYGSAWQLLLDEYDDKQALIHTHIHSFVNLPKMRSESVNDLKKLRDTASAALAALANLGCPVNQWDDLLVYLISQKFSPRTRNEWSLKRSGSAESPSYKELNEFLTLRIRGLADFPDPSNAASDNSRNKARSTVNNVSVVKCVHCAGNHPLAKCENFLSKSTAERNALVRQKQLCFNCLRSGHFPQKCPSKYRCNHCRRLHHSTLHFNAGETSPASASPAPASLAVDSSGQQTPASVPSVAGIANVAHIQNVQTEIAHTPNVLLATAWVDLHTLEGRCFKVRALLDQGSTFSFISESLCQTLRTKRQRAELHIRCFGEKYTGLAKSRVSLQLAPCAKSAPMFPLTAYVFQRITSYAASQIRSLATWPHLRDLPLADPNPASQHPIHMLIGADLYGSLLSGEIRQGPLGTPTAQKTVIGWILSGPTGTSPAKGDDISVLHCTSECDTNSLLRKFWEVEEVSDEPPLSEEDNQCENHFASTHSRTPHGRYIVRLPFKSNFPINIGESLSIARSLYARTESRLRSRPEITVPYNEFLREYLELGHMEPVKESETPSYTPVYIPHHAILRDSSATTKLRVVFNASCKTRDGTSLNDHLLIGPKLQQDLPAIIARWRQWRYVYTADIAKMFRQILIDPVDADFQRILWRPTPESSLLPFRLLTVTYGLAPAPYLAMRVLKQLAMDEGHAFPAAAPIVENSIYVDDALFGADEIHASRTTRDQLIGLMQKGGFQLRKWAANSSKLLDDIPGNQHDHADHLLAKDETLKILGLSWLPREDFFRFVTSPPTTTNPTRRTVLSFIAKLYDPLGWAAPVVIVAKILLQELWLLKGEWDDPIPRDLAQRWLNYTSDLPQLEGVRIPRWTGQHRDNLWLEVHGFADASNRAYAAVAYLRVVHSLTNFQVSLICAKTKVAPVKTLSIPRLELNAVVLLGRLLLWIRKSLSLSHVPISEWTDSMIVLAWLRQHPSTWTTYVANRVSELQTSLATVSWNHVPSRDNPADCASRGLTAAELASHNLWWSGPPWLQRTSTSWPKHNPVIDTTITEQVSAEQRKSTAHHIDGAQEWELLHRYSSWTRLVRITAYVRRFVENLKKRISSLPKKGLPIEVSELREAAEFWFRLTQQTHFPKEWNEVTNDRPVSRSSSLRAFHPMMGTDSLLRLGGRLKNAAIGYTEKHPVLLPKHRVSELLIDHAHQTTLHGGTQLTLRTLRQKYWIIGGRNLVKAHIRQCVICARHSAKTSTQLMGDLPPSRVNPSPPFSHTGVDYAGPFGIIPVVGRGQRTVKHYVALFVCLATKAIHLETVEDYSTTGFLAAFNRFVSRRGLPSHIYSDNGTNFHGADRELRNHFRSVSLDPALQVALANDQIQWHFIPAAAPHFGGLWEAGVKSFKFHLKRVIGSRTLSKTEFATLLCQIEACLNSRPIAALSDDPYDLSALTPGHFLIGRPLVAIPEESVLDIDANRLSRWQLVRSMQEQIWRSWSKDYLQSLQVRRKWSVPQPAIAINDLVIVKNPLLPPSKWELARVIQVHPGSDGYVRVVTLRTANSQYKRPIAQICKLPVSSRHDTSEQQIVRSCT